MNHLRTTKQLKVQMTRHSMADSHTHLKADSLTLLKVRVIRRDNTHHRDLTRHRDSTLLSRASTPLSKANISSHLVTLL